MSISPPLAVVILAGGQGKRLGLDLPKVLAEVCGKSALDHVLDAASALAADRSVVVVCYQREKVIEATRNRAGVVCVDQGQPLGTGHAVIAACKGLEGFRGDVLVLFGDGPLVRAQTLLDLVAAHRRAPAACTMLTARIDAPTGYGRIVRRADGSLQEVVEEKDATDAVRAIQEVHCGLAIFQSEPLRAALSALRNDNAQREYYLTDAYQLLQEQGGAVKLASLEDHHEALGFNTPADLLQVRRLMRQRILQAHTGNGVLIEDPDTVFVDADVEIGPGTRILPFTVIRGKVQIGAGCEVGPFSHLRHGTVLADGAEVGNFVEAKNSFLGEHVKAKHLTYLGDTEIGAGTNIGAGTITANYDGKAKHRTVIGKNAFVGSGSILVAPVRVGDGSTTGAGAVVTSGKDVPDGSVVVGIPARPLLRRDPNQERGKPR